MLTKIGFKEKNIFSARSVQAALSIVKKHDMDIVISDYNFGVGLNGKQFYEELMHYELIRSECVFIIITGDGSKRSVRTLTELKPDDYILKPFSADSLKYRIFRSLKRKESLRELFFLQKKERYEEGLNCCDELILHYPEYKFIIEKFRGEFLTKLSLHEQAKSLYKSVLKTKRFLWTKIGYANALANLGDVVEADRLLDKVLELDPHNIDVNISKCNLKIISSDIPLAIKHYKFINSLTLGCSERELVLVNLCLAQRDYIEAINRYDNYITINKDTYRDNVFAKLNKARVLLYACCNLTRDKEKYTNQARCIVKEILSCNNDDVICGVQEEIDLIVAHIAIESKHYDLAFNYLKKILSNNKLDHFYAIYQLGWIFDLLCCEIEFSEAIVNLSEKLQHNHSDSVLSSKIAMVEQLVKNNNEKKTG